MTPRIIEGNAAKRFSPKEKWELLSPFLKRHGREALSYATLQDGMEYFVNDFGYIAYTSVTHPVFARHGRRITLSDPVCAQADLKKMLAAFLMEKTSAAFAVISEKCAE